MLKHLHVEAQWDLANFGRISQSPYQNTASVQQLTDSVRLDVERNPEELEESPMDILERPCETRRFAIRRTGGAVLRTSLG